MQNDKKATTTVEMGKAGIEVLVAEGPLATDTATSGTALLQCNASLPQLSMGVALSLQHPCGGKAALHCRACYPIHMYVCGCVRGQSSFHSSGSA